jgi:hypothetical protein
LESELKRDWETTNPDRNWTDDKQYIREAWNRPE